jgi:hypothetical protein
MKGLVARIRDAGWLLLIVLAVPFGILLVGLPIVLVIRLVLEVAGLF